MECDVVAASVDGRSLLIGEVKMHFSPRQAQTVLENLRQKATRLPPAASVAHVVPAIFTAGKRPPNSAGYCIPVERVLEALK